MRYSLEVCLAALTVMPGIAPLAAQTPRIAQNVPPALTLQKGIHVTLANTHSAVAMPDADTNGALIVTLTADGRVYTGAELTSPAALESLAKEDRSRGTSRKVFLKADSRVPYAEVTGILDALHSSGFASVDLLTAQSDPSDAGHRVLPKGLDVRISGPESGRSRINTVRVTLSARQWPMLDLDGRQTSLQDLQAALRERFKNRSGNVVLLMRDGAPSFWQVVSVTDICRSVGAEVSLGGQRQSPTSHLQDGE